MIVAIGDARQQFFSDGLGDDLGGSSFGRLLNIQATAMEQAWYIEWEKELADGIRENDVAVLFFHDGSYSHSVTGRNHDLFTPDKMSPADRLDLYLVPNDRAYETMIWQDGLCNRIRLWWETEGVWDRARVMGNRGATITSSTPLAEFRLPVVHQFPTNENPDVDVYGTWYGDLQSKSIGEEIRCEITSPGYADEAIFKWTWGSRVVTGLVASSSGIELVNGVRVRFHKNAWFAVGDYVPIRTGLPESYTSGKWWPGGQITYRVDTINTLGEITIPATSHNPRTVTINTPPVTPAFTATPSYVDGSGQIAVSFTAPSESDITHYRIYQNRVYLGERQVHWNPIIQGTVSSGGTFALTVTGLGEGWNRISGTVIDSNGLESGECTFEILLDASLNEIAPPNPPIGIACKVLSDATVQVKVWADSTSDKINIYHIDKSTGAYGSAVLEISNYKTGDCQELTGIWEPDGSVLEAFIGARAQNGTIEETNTDIVDHISRMPNPAPAIDYLSYEVIP